MIVISRKQIGKSDCITVLLQLCLFFLFWILKLHNNSKIKHWEEHSESEKKDKKSGIRNEKLLPDKEPNNALLKHDASIYKMIPLITLICFVFFTFRVRDS